MSNLAFSYKGNDFDLDVSPEFLKLPVDEQDMRLVNWIETNYGDKAVAPKTEKGLLDYLALLERPAQAIKVGFKESQVGGNLFRELGGVDLTPEEGFGSGFRKGWMGEDEVRTQDFLPDDMNPILKGVLGFAGDVATDPLTYAGGGVFRAGAAIAKRGTQSIRKAIPRSVADQLMKMKASALDTTFMGYGLQDIARGLNYPIGRGNHIKGIGRMSTEQASQRGIIMEKAMRELSDAINGRANSSDFDIERIRAAFRNYSERPGEWSNGVFNPYTKIVDGGGPGTLSPDIAEAIKADIHVMGPELRAVADKFKDITEDFLNIEKAYGIPVSNLENIGYFPHVATKQGKEWAELEDVIQKIDPITGVPLNAGYVAKRAAEGSVDDMNMFKLEQYGSKTPNPVDHPWEIPFGDKFFHTDPVIAWQRRWTQHKDSLQRKWFIDEVSDVDLLGGQITGVTKRAFDETGDAVHPRVHGFGYWLKKNTETDEFEYLRRNSVGDRVWAPISPDMREFIPVSFVKQRHLRRPSEYAEEGNKLREMHRERLLREGSEAGDLRLGLARNVRETTLKRIDDESYRLSQIDLANIMENEAIQFKVPTQIARQMEDTMSMMTGEHNIAPFLKLYDTIQNTWKSWTLAVRPGFHTRNAVGNIFNAYMVAGMGANIPKAVELFKDAAKLQYYARFDGSDLFRKETVENIRNVRKGKGAAIDQSLLKLQKIDDAKWTSPNFAGTGYSMQEIARGAKIRGINAGHYRADILRDMETAAELTADGRGLAKLKKHIVDSPAVAAGFAFGGTIEGNARYALFLNTLREIKNNPSKYDWISPTGEKISLDKLTAGKFFKPILEDDYDSLTGGFAQTERVITKEDAILDIAGQKVKEALFDYTDLSRFERNVMKRAMPFYTWTRKNIPAQIKSLVTNPQRAEKIELARQQFEHNSGGYDASEYGAFWGDRVPIFLGEESQGVVKAFTMLNTLPMADLQRVLKPQHLIAEMAGPIPKTLFEQIFNYDSFRSSATKTVKLKESYQESKDFLGVALPPRLWHLSQLIVPLTEINRLNPAGVFGTKTRDPSTGSQTVTEAYGGFGARRESNPVDIPEAARWLRFFSGFRVYDVNIQQQRYMMNKNLENDLQRLYQKLKYAKMQGEERKAEDIMAFIEEVQSQNYTDPYNAEETE